MGVDDVIGALIIVALVIFGIFLIPGIVWLAWQCVCGVFNFIIGCFAFFGKLLDMYLDAFPALLIFIFPAFLVCFSRGGR